MIKHRPFGRCFLWFNYRLEKIRINDRIYNDMAMLCWGVRTRLCVVSVGTKNTSNQ